MGSPISILSDGEHSGHKNNDCGLGSDAAARGGGYAGDITMVRMFGGVEGMIGQYTLMFGKSIYGATLVKMVLH